jgi:hypothetical protein
MAVDATRSDPGGRIPHKWLARIPVGVKTFDIIGVCLVAAGCGRQDPTQ